MHLFVFHVVLLARVLLTMAIIPPEIFSMITINGEEYMPTPHELNPEFAEDMVWTSFPYNSLFLSDPEWYDAQGQDQITQRRIWGVRSESAQIDQFRQLIHERPERALDMMFAAAAKGKPHVVRFLLEQGVKASAKGTDGDDMTLVPLHAAAYQGRFECVEILLEEGKLDVNTKDDMGGTALMRACWGKRPRLWSIYLRREQIWTLDRSRLCPLAMRLERMRSSSQEGLDVLSVRNCLCSMLRG